jgi:putative membrane protein
MSTLTAMTAMGPAAAHVDGRYGPGFGWWIVFPILWFALIVTVVVLVARRWRRAPWGPGYPGGPGGPGGWAAAHRPGSARAVLSERFARGEIDEQEYRARLEVLLATEERPG